MAMDIHDLNVELAKTTQKITDHITTCGIERVRSDKKIEEIWMSINDRDLKNSKMHIEVERRLEVGQNKIQADFKELRNSVVNNFKWLIGILISGMASGLLFLLAEVFNWMR